MNFLGVFFAFFYHNLIIYWWSCIPQVYDQTNRQISEETLENENNHEIATEEDLHGSKASIGTTNTTISETVNCDAMPENSIWILPIGWTWEIGWIADLLTSEHILS